MLDIGIGNYRGSLHIKEYDQKYFWAVECDLDNEDKWEWEEIPKYLYFSILQFHQDNLV